MKEIRAVKNEIRNEIIRRLREQEPCSRDKRSGDIQKKLLALKEFQLAQTVMIYVAMPTEVDTMCLIEEALRQGKKVAAPYVTSCSGDMIAAELTSLNDLKKGAFGILEPKQGAEKKLLLKDIDLIVVPGVAFDKKKRRLGRGKGFYDRFLSSKELASPATIGLAFDFQIVDTLPAGPYDRPVSRIITG